MKKIYIILLFLFPLILNAAHTITVDGYPSDWLGTPSSTVHAVVYSSGEWIYTGEADDERNDYNETQPSSNNDITEVRFGQDGTYLYMLVEMDGITSVDYPHLCFVFSNGSSSQTFIGDDSYRQNTNGGAATGLGNSNQYGRLMDIHSSSGSPVIELYDGGSWYGAPSGGQQISISTSNNVIEARINLSDLGLSSSSTASISFMSCPNRIGWNNDVDATAWQVDDVSNGVDVMTQDASSGTNAWVRDLSNGDVDYYSSVNFNNATLPVTLSTFTAQYLAGKPLLYWTTQSETDNMGWFVYRNKIEDFTSATKVSGMIEGHGTTTQAQSYIYEDVIANPQVGDVYYYWLESVDYSGTIHHFDKVAMITIPDINNPNPNVTPPQVYDLLASPNPFNESTKISFTLTQSAMVDVAIYDVKGALVKSFDTQHVTANDEVLLKWYGNDENSKSLSNGIYLYSLKVNGQDYATKQVILMK